MRPPVTSLRSGWKWHTIFSLEQGAFDTASDIKMYAPAIKLENGDQLRYERTFNNTTDHDVIYGIGENEMCVLFG